MVYSWVDSTSLLLIGQNMWDTNRFFCACEGQYLRHSALSIERNLARGYSCCSCCVLCGVLPFFSRQKHLNFPSWNPMLMSFGGIHQKLGWAHHEKSEAKTWSKTYFRGSRSPPTTRWCVTVSVCRCVSNISTKEPLVCWCIFSSKVSHLGNISGKIAMAIP